MYTLRVIHTSSELHHVAAVCTSGIPIFGFVDESSGGFVRLRLESSVIIDESPSDELSVRLGP